MQVQEEAKDQLGEGPTPCPFLDESTSPKGPHTAAFRLNSWRCLNAEGLFLFPFVATTSFPVTRATWHRSRKKKHPKFLPVARQRKCRWIFAVCIPCWFPNNELVFQAKHNSILNTHQCLLDFAAKLINRFCFRGMRIKGMLWVKKQLGGRFAFLSIEASF